MIHCPKCSSSMKDGWLGFIGSLRWTDSQMPGPFKRWKWYTESQGLSGYINMPRSIRAKRCAKCHFVWFESPVPIRKDLIHESNKRCENCRSPQSNGFIAYGSALLWTRLPLFFWSFLGWFVFSKTIAGFKYLKKGRAIPAVYCQVCKGISIAGNETSSAK